jgi:hypothetical protein
MKAYISALAKADIELGRHLCPADYAHRAVALKAQIMYGLCAEHEDCAVAKSKDMKDEVATVLINGCNSLKPLCLDCLRKNFCGAKDLVCRVGHATPAASGV